MILFDFGVAWLSLDEGVAEIVLWIRYVVFPTACGEILFFPVRRFNKYVIRAERFYNPCV